MKVCYFGAYHPNYARNLVIRKGLESLGIEVVQCQVPQRLRGGERYVALWREWRRIKEDPSVLLVAEHNQMMMPLAWWLSRIRRIPVVFDPHISLYDTNVFDRQLIPQGSIKARRYYWLDRIPMHLADALLADTDAHRQYYVSEFKVDSQRIYVIPVGANESVFYPRSSTNRPSESLRLVFWGKFIPLHGIETILCAAKALEDKGVSFVLDLFGIGQTFDRMRALARQLDVGSVRFAGWIAQTELAEEIAKADMCLGTFGRSAKASRVVPNKVYEGLAMCKPVLTGDSPAIRAQFEHRRHLYTVPMADAQALAEGIIELMHDAQLRDRIAQQGYELFCAEYATPKIGEKVRAVFEAVVSR